MSSDKKRTYALYRVSTLGQVEKDDIPMQKQCCREFCEKQDWDLIREFSEKGISGFKVSAKDRDAIQEIQRDALEGKFDILLVFMFDRLGRRDDETPFVVEWFVKNGIEVWSAMEGQQRFDTHVDKLLNYIRYWQASGESIKTSIRVKTRMEQLTQDGHYTGGIVPFGYRLEKRGRVNKKNQAVGDLVIVPEEAEIVRLVFQKYVYEGYGAQRLCRYLQEEGYRNKKGRNIPTTSINRMIKNPIYIGVIRNGESQSELLKEIQIIDEATFKRAQEIMEKRVTHHNDVPLNTRGQSLLVGNVYCGHCGNRLTLTTSGRKRTRKDGTIHREVRARYQCHYNVRHPGECDGQSGYGVTKLDGIVDQIIHMQFAKICRASAQDLVQTQQAREVDLLKAKIKMLQAQHQEKKHEHDDLCAETIKVIRGTSKLNAELLNSLEQEARSAVQETLEALSLAETELQSFLSNAKCVREEYAQLVSWAQLYDQSSFEAKKMIVAQFVKSIYVHAGYELEIEFNISFADFQRLCVEADESKEAGVLLLQPPA